MILFFWESEEGGMEPNSDINTLSEPQKDHALKMMAGAKPRFRKGHFGKKYDRHTCGNCGAGLDVYMDYCYKCGFRILWDNPRCLTDYK